MPTLQVLGLRISIGSCRERSQKRSINCIRVLVSHSKCFLICRKSSSLCVHFPALRMDENCVWKILVDAYRSLLLSKNRCSELLLARGRAAMGKWKKNPSYKRYFSEYDQHLILENLQSFTRSYWHCTPLKAILDQVTAVQAWRDCGISIGLIVWDFSGEGCLGSECLGVAHFAS